MIQDDCTKLTLNERKIRNSKVSEKRNMRLNEKLKCYHPSYSDGRSMLRKKLRMSWDDNE